MVHMKVMNAASLVAVAGAEDGDLYRDFRTDGAVAFLPRSLFKRVSVSSPQIEKLRFGDWSGVRVIFG